jgi:hypothetical protein
VPALRWGGPALIALFALGTVALLPAANASPLARWILSDVLAPERMLPLVGLGVAFGLLGVRPLLAALLLCAFGVAAGLLAENQLLQLLDRVPQAATHLFFAGPIAFLAIGAALATGARMWSWLAPLAALIVGAMLALVVRMTDPSLHDPLYTWMPLLIAAWIVAALALTLRAFRRRWFAIFARILGSWLLAIGLLYGGASLLLQRVAPLPPPPAPSAPEPGFDRSAIPGLPAPEQPFPGAGGRPPP